MNNKPYYIITNESMAICLRMLTQSDPYIYNNKYKEGEYVWSFVNDEAFQEALEIAHKLIDKNSKKK